MYIYFNRKKIVYIYMYILYMYTYTYIKYLSAHDALQRDYIPITVREF